MLLDTTVVLVAWAESQVVQTRDERGYRPGEGYGCTVSVSHDEEPKKYGRQIPHPTLR